MLPGSTDPGVKALLQHIIKDQGEEVQQMMDWGAKPDSGSMMKTMQAKPGMGEAGHPNPLHKDPPGGLTAMGKPGAKGARSRRPEPEPVHDEELVRKTWPGAY